MPYVCPHHPATEHAAAGICPICGLWLVDRRAAFIADQLQLSLELFQLIGAILGAAALTFLILVIVNHTSRILAPVCTSTYCIASTTVQLPPRKPVTYEFSIVGRGDTAVRDFIDTTDVRTEAFLVRKDLASIQRLRPAYDPQSGTFTLQGLTLPTDGPYRIIADFATAKAGHATAWQDVEADDSRTYIPIPLGAATYVDTVDNIKVTRTSDAPVVGKTATLAFALQLGGVPVTDLQRSLGALGDLVLIREHTLELSHAQPVNIIAQDGTMRFTADFPRAGLYKAYLQFRRAGLLETAGFVIAVGTSVTE